MFARLFLGDGLFELCKKIFFWQAPCFLANQKPFLKNIL